MLNTLNSATLIIKSSLCYIKLENKTNLLILPTQYDVKPIAIGQSEAPNIPIVEISLRDIH